MDKRYVHRKHTYKVLIFHSFLQPIIFRIYPDKRLSIYLLHCCPDILCRFSVSCSPRYSAEKILVISAVCQTASILFFVRHTMPVADFSLRQVRRSQYSPTTVLMSARNLTCSITDWEITACYFQMEL